jgi:hypothetical protein
MILKFITKEEISSNTSWVENVSSVAVQSSENSEFYNLTFYVGDIRSAINIGPYNNVVTIALMNDYFEMQQYWIAKDE